MRIALLVIVSQLAGCTIAFGALGGVTASSANKESRAKKQPETASVGARILIGAVIGLVIDGLIINASLDDCCPENTFKPAN
jgi:hypothetical protein